MNNNSSNSQVFGRRPQTKRKPLEFLNSTFFILCHSMYPLNNLKVLERKSASNHFLLLLQPQQKWFDSQLQDYGYCRYLRKCAIFTVSNLVFCSCQVKKLEPVRTNVISITLVRTLAHCVHYATTANPLIFTFRWATVSILRLP